MNVQDLRESRLGVLLLQIAGQMMMNGRALTGCGMLIEMKRSRH